MTARSRNLVTEVVALSTTLAAIQCGSGSPPVARQPPRIVFVATMHDFDRVEQGALVEARFDFRNAGGTSLTIDNVKTACDCRAESPVRIVPPGRHGSIRARCDTTNTFGRQRRTVTVYTNDPEQPFTTLSMTGEVDLDVAADPTRLYVGHVRRGQRVEGDVHIRSRRPLTLQAEPGGRVLHASLGRMRVRSPGNRLTLVIRPDAPLGRFSETVTIRTSSARRPILEVPVMGTVEDHKEAK